MTYQEFWMAMAGERSAIEVAAEARERGLTPAGWLDAARGGAFAKCSGDEQRSSLRDAAERYGMRMEWAIADAS